MTVPAYDLVQPMALYAPTGPPEWSLVVRGQSGHEARLHGEDACYGPELWHIAAAYELGEDPGPVVLGELARRARGPRGWRALTWRAVRGELGDQALEMARGEWTLGEVMSSLGVVAVRWEMWRSE